MTTKCVTLLFRQAEVKKEAGNKAYSAKDYKLAIKLYSEAIGKEMIIVYSLES